MAKTVYPDQNALIYALEASRNNGFADNLRQATRDGHLHIVLSAWHWVETARATDVLKATELATFMDSLSPGWLRERRDLQRDEIEEDFFRFAGVPYQRKSPVGTRIDLFTSLNSHPPSPNEDLSSPTIVRTLMKDPSLLNRIYKSYELNAQALGRLRAARAAKKLTTAIRTAAVSRHIKELLPTETPAGLIISRDMQIRYLESVQVDSLPSFSVENRLAERSWTGWGKPDWNTFVDKFHLISALPHVDLVVSDDRFFRNAVDSLRQAPLPIAQLMSFAEFSSPVN